MQLANGRVSLRFLELFAGVGGLAMGLERAGHVCVAHAEIAKHQRAVLAARWPDVPLLSDVRLLHGGQLVDLYGPIDLLAGGSPCQGLSGAGLRLGLEDPRSILFYEQIRIWEEINAAQDSDCLLLWENVDGARSTHEGKDFACVLSSIVGTHVAPPDVRHGGGWSRAGVAAGPTGIAAWRVLDAQFFGVPQRRSRVFVIGTRAGSLDPAEVLLVGESLSRDSAPRRQARQGTARRAPARPRVGRRAAPEEVSVGDSGESSDSIFAFVNASEPCHSEGVALTVTGRNGDAGCVLAFSAKDAGDDATVDVSPTLRAGTARSGNDNAGVMPAVFAFNAEQITSAAIRSRCIPNEPSPTLSRGGQMHTASVIPLQDVTKGMRMERDITTGIGIGSESDPMYTLLAGTQHGDAVLRGTDDERAKEQQMEGDHHVACVTGNVTHTLTCEGADASEDGTGRGAPIVAGTLQAAYRGVPSTEEVLAGKVVVGEHIAKCLTTREAQANDAETGNFPVSASGRPRRLMPVECERLMSWPDGHTNIVSARGKQTADGPRYRACGNGVASVQTHWIGEQLARVCAEAIQTTADVADSEVA